MQHDFLWFSIDWSNSRFIWTLIIVAVIFGVFAFVVDRFYRRFTWSDNWAGYYLLALALAWVIFKAVAWDVAGWVHWIFWLIWWGALIASLLALIPIVRRLVTFIARILTGLVWGILLLLLVLIPLLWNTWAPDINTYADSDPTGLNPSVSTDLPSVEGSPSPTAGSSNPSPTGGSSSSPGPTVGTSNCEDNTWDVSTVMPTEAPWSTQDLVRDANTSSEAYQAFQDWYNNTALDNTALYYQLAEAIHANPPSESDLSVGGQASSQMSCSTVDVKALFIDAKYYPQHTAIRVELKNGSVIRLMQASGQIE